MVKHCPRCCGSSSFGDHFVFYDDFVVIWMVVFGIVFLVTKIEVEVFRCGLGSVGVNNFGEFVMRSVDIVVYLI